MTITMTDTEYCIRTENGTVNRPWNIFQNVTRVDDFWILRVSKRAAAAIPTSALNDEQTVDFLALMREKGLH